MMTSAWQGCPLWQWQTSVQWRKLCSLCRRAGSAIMNSRYSSTHLARDPSLPTMKGLPHCVSPNL
eukprot:13078733-Heterocapsa_arctica.AAC.1